MEIETPAGKAKGQPLSDIQEYNIRLQKQSRALWALFWLLAIIFVSGAIFLFWLHKTQFLYHVMNTWKMLRCI